MTKKFIKLPIVILGVILSGCASSLSSPTSVEDSGNAVSISTGEYVNISVAELQTALENKDFVFINVHIPFAGNIPDTDLSIPFDKIRENTSQLPEDMDAKIIIYCRSGSMSSVAAKELLEIGYTNIWNLEGGFNGWEQAGLPLDGK
jgi:rhodanese-related sulfurtransferase